MAGWLARDEAKANANAIAYDHTEAVLREKRKSDSSDIVEWYYLHIKSGVFVCVKQRARERERERWIEIEFNFILHLFIVNSSLILSLVANSDAFIFYPYSFSPFLSPLFVHGFIFFCIWKVTCCNTYVNYNDKPIYFIYLYTYQRCYAVGTTDWGFLTLYLHNYFTIATSFSARFTCTMCRAIVCIQQKRSFVAECVCVCIEHCFPSHSIHFIMCEHLKWHFFLIVHQNDIKCYKIRSYIEFRINIMLKCQINWTNKRKHNKHVESVEEKKKQKKIARSHTSAKFISINMKWLNDSISFVKERERERNHWKR